MTQGVLFVCTGNICRSPAAEVLFAAAAPTAQVASAGTGAWHIGEGATQANVRAAARAGYNLSPHRAQQFQPAHFQRYDWLIGMTRAHVTHMEGLRPRGSATPVRLFSSFDPARLPTDVPDPYGQDAATYDAMWRLLADAMPALIAEIVGQRPE